MYSVSVSFQTEIYDKCYFRIVWVVECTLMLRFTAHSKSESSASQLRTGRLAVTAHISEDIIKSLDICPLK